VPSIESWVTGQVGHRSRGSWVIGKRVVDFLLVLIELFSLGVTAEAIRANIGSELANSLQRGRLTKNFR